MDAPDLGTFCRLGVEISVFVSCFSLVNSISPFKRVDLREWLVHVLVVFKKVCGSIIRNKTKSQNTN